MKNIKEKIIEALELIPYWVYCAIGGLIGLALFTGAMALCHH